MSSDARKMAEEALATVALRYPNGWGGYDTLSVCTDALRALLAAEPAKGADQTERPCGCYAPDGDRCPKHPSPPASDEVREAAEMLRLTLGMRDVKHACDDRACSNVALAALNLLAALRSDGR